MTLSNTLAKPRNSIKEVNKVCKAVLKLTSEDFEEVESMANDRANYSHPFKGATVKKMNGLGRHNRKVNLALKAERTY